MEILEKIVAGDGATKYLLGLDDGARVEAVFLNLEDNNKDSLCISSQVGCTYTCTFCSTGRIGFSRNMTPNEIVEQVTTVLDDLRFVQSRRFDLSYMGMGEPMMNLDGVLASKLDLSRHYPDFQFHLSTVGIVPKIRELAMRSPDIALQISLHAPTDELRTEIMAVNKSYPIAELLDAAEEYASAGGRVVTFNYCLMNGVNDSPEHARELAALLAGRAGVRVQLVNFNPHISIGYLPSTDERAQVFLQSLGDAGVRCHYGRQLGGKEGAGCGQLDADYAARELRPVRNG